MVGASLGGVVHVARPSRLDDRAATRRLERALEQAEQALSAGVDDVRLAQDRQQRGRFRDRALRGIDRSGQHRLDVVVPLGGRDRRGGRLADDREDRALDGLGHGLVRGLRAGVERVREVEAVEPLLALEALGDPREDLARDDARVAARAHERAEARGVGHPVGVGIRPGPVRLLEGRADRREHVGAGVAVRDREDVERVDLVDVRLEAGDRGPEGREEPGAVA